MQWKPRGEVLRTPGIARQHPRGSEYLTPGLGYNPTMDDSPDPLKPKFKRVLLKLSGEGFGPPGKSGINIDDTLKIAQQIKKVHERGVQLAVVIGAGNLLRGEQFSAGGAVIK